MLVHKNKEQVERLLQKLTHEDVDIFVHIDKKCTFGPNDLKTPENVYFTQKRIDAGLFEFSLLEAEFELIRTAKNHGDYRYYALVSGQCYPLHKMTTIHDFLAESYPKPFIDIIAPTKNNYVTRMFQHIWILKRFKLNTYDYLKKHFSLKMFKIIKYIPAGFVFIVSMIKELIYKSPHARLVQLGYVNCAGAQWWIFPDRISDIMLQERENIPFCEAISDAFGGDETFFQTAIMTHKEECGIELDEQGNYMERRWFHIFHEGHPIILCKNNYEQLCESNMLFARKFDINIDREILDMLDEKANHDVKHNNSQI